MRVGRRASCSCGRTSSGRCASPARSKRSMRPTPMRTLSRGRRVPGFPRGPPSRAQRLPRAPCWRRPWRKRRRNTERRRRARRTGAATAWRRARSSSGRDAPTGCMTGCCIAKPAVTGRSSGLRPRSSGSREAILLLAIGAVVSGLSLRCVEPMLPQLAMDFSTSVSAASIIVTAFAVAYAGAVLLQGPLGDRYGKLRVVAIGMALAGLASLGCAAAWSLGSLAAMRFLMAIFASAPVALGIAYIGDVIPLEDRQETIARFIAGSIFGQTLGPLFGGVLTDSAGWRRSFVALGFRFLVRAALLFLRSLFIAGAAILFVRTRREWPALGPGRFEPLAAHARLLARAPVRWRLAVGVAETFFFFGGYVFLGAYLRERFDLSYTVVGLVLAGYGVGGLAYSSLVRFFVRLGDRRLVVLGGVLGLVFFSAIVLANQWGYAVPSTFGLGLAFYLMHNTIQTKASEVAPDARGSAIALYASAWAIGQASGVAALGVAVAYIGYASAILAAAVGFMLLGFWLRYNMARLHA